MAAEQAAAQAERVIWLVMDSVGVGEMPDAAQYGDAGSNTLGNLARAVGGLRLPNLARLGLGRLTEIAGVPPREPAGACGRCAIASPGKETMSGHWEMAGVRIQQAMRTYPEGFPPEVIGAFEAAIGRRALGNKPASGTVILDELGEEHMRTGCPIVYTSADSVFQIAAHEEIVPVEQLYRWCEIARELLSGDAPGHPELRGHQVGRVIARPFVGRPGAFVRTPRRHDYALQPAGETLLDALHAGGVPVAAVGKIHDIFSGRGIGLHRKAVDNFDNLRQVHALLGEIGHGLIYSNLVDFDMLYGHRNDAPGYARALQELDAALPTLMERLGPRDVLLLTADHGCDPTTPSTDHSREYVPALWWGGPIRAGVDFGTRPTMADLGATVADLLGNPYRGAGESLLPLIGAGGSAS